MSENKNTNSSGIGVCGLLGVAFVILKLCGVIDWSWWWVTAPFWGFSAICLVTFIFGLIYYGTVEVVKTTSKKISDKKKISKDFEVIDNENT